jgi:hypothetical protein
LTPKRREARRAGPASRLALLGALALVQGPEVPRRHPEVSRLRRRIRTMRGRRNGVGPNGNIRL